MSNLALSPTLLNCVQYLWPVLCLIPKTAHFSYFLHQILMRVVWQGKSSTNKKYQTESEASYCFFQKWAVLWLDNWLSRKSVASDLKLMWFLLDLWHLRCKQCLFRRPFLVEIPHLRLHHRMEHTKRCLVFPHTDPVQGNKTKSRSQSTGGMKLHNCDRRVFARAWRARRIVNPGSTDALRQLRVWSTKIKTTLVFQAQRAFIDILKDDWCNLQCLRSSCFSNGVQPTCFLLYLNPAQICAMDNTTLWKGCVSVSLIFKDIEIGWSDRSRLRQMTRCVNATRTKWLPCNFSFLCQK